MALPSPRARQEGWTRFGVGAFECTVVSDGPLDLEPPAVVFAGHDAAKIDELLKAAFVPPGRMAIDQNLLVIDTGAQLVLFEAGSGGEGGRSLFGPAVGRALGNLRASGIEPGQVTTLILSHLHPDHCWGLVEAGRPTFPNATIAVSAAELDHLDRAARSTASDAPHRQLIDGALASLRPYREMNRVRRLADGEEVVPGITAQAAPGHSPGHMTFAVRSEGETLLVLGDVAHHPVLHLAQPAWTTTYDDDGALAARTRARVFKEAIATRPAILAYHFPFPGLGHLQERHGAYRWLPAPLELAAPR